MAKKNRRIRVRPQEVVTRSIIYGDPTGAEEHSARTERDARAADSQSSSAVVSASALHGGVKMRSSTRITTRRSAFPRTPRPTTSKRLTESSHASTTPTSTRNRTRKSASKKSTRPTRSSQTPRSASATTRSARIGRSSRKGADVPPGPADSNTSTQGSPARVRSATTPAADTVRA